MHKIDDFSEERLMELSEIVGMSDAYSVRMVPLERVTEIMWLLKPISPCTMEMQPSMFREGCYYLLIKNHGVQDA